MNPLTSSDPAALGPVTLQGRLGKGGMGQVYLGVTGDGDRFAVKVINAARNQNPELHARFAREAQAMGMVQGPGTASLLAHSGPEDPEPWLAMEYVPGLNLSDFIKRDSVLEPTDATALALLLAEALADIHRAGQERAGAECAGRPRPAGQPACTNPG